MDSPPVLGERGRLGARSSLSLENLVARDHGKVISSGGSVLADVNPGGFLEGIGWVRKNGQV